MLRYNGVSRVAVFVVVLLQDHCVSVNNIQGVLEHLADHASYLSHVSRYHVQSRTIYLWSHDLGLA